MMQSEAKLMQAISDHMTETTEEAQVATQYVVIVQALNGEGNEELLWASSNEKWSADYAMVGYVYEQVKHRMARQWDEIFTDDEPGPIDES